MVSRLRGRNRSLVIVCPGLDSAEDAQAAHAVRQEDHGEGEEAHPAEQVGLAAPEEQAVGHRFDVGENGGAAGGVTGHHLEKAVGERGDRAVDHEGQGGEGGDQRPAEDGDEKPVADVQFVAAAEEPPEGYSRSGDDQRGDEQGRQVALPGVEEGADHRQQHGGAGDHHQLAHHVGDGSVVHRVLDPCGRL